MIDFVALSNSAGQLLVSARPFIKPALVAGALGAVVYHSSSSPQDLLSLKIHKLAQKLEAFTDPNNPPRYVGRHWYAVTDSVGKMDWIIQAFRWLWSVPCYLMGKDHLGDIRAFALDKLSEELKEAGEGIHTIYRSLDLKDGGQSVDLLSTDALIAWAALMHKDLMLNQPGSVKEHFEEHFPDLPENFKATHEGILEAGLVWPWLTFGEVPPFNKICGYFRSEAYPEFKWEIRGWPQHFNKSNFTPDDLDRLLRWNIEKAVGDHPQEIKDRLVNVYLGSGRPLAKLALEHGLDIVERKNPSLTQRVDNFRAGDTITFEGKEYTLVEDIGFRALPGVYAAWRVESEEGPSEEELESLRSKSEHVTEDNINHQAIFFFKNAVVGKMWRDDFKCYDNGDYRRSGYRCYGENHPVIEQLNHYMHDATISSPNGFYEDSDTEFNPNQARLVREYPYNRIKLLQEDEKIRQPNNPPTSTVEIRQPNNPPTFTVYS